MHRRTFVSSAVLLTPVVSIDAASSDFVTDHVTRELASVHRRTVARRHVTGEDVRLVAGNLRLLAAHPDHRRVRRVLRIMDRDTLLRTPVDRQALRQHTERWFGRLPDLKDPELPPDLEWQLRAEIVAQVQSDPGDLLETLAGNLDDVATYLNGGSVPNVRFLDRSHGRLHTIQSAPDPQLYGPQWLCSWWKTFFFTFTFLGILLAMSGAGAVLGGINLFVAQFFNLLTWLGGC